VLCPSNKTTSRRSCSGYARRKGELRSGEEKEPLCPGHVELKKKRGRVGGGGRRRKRGVGGIVLLAKKPGP